MSKKLMIVTPNVDLTDAQKYALYRSVERHMQKVGTRSAKTDEPIRLDGSISGSTAMALDRKGMVTRKRDHYYKNAYELTVHGRLKGYEEFVAVRGVEPAAWADELQADEDKKARGRKERIGLIANLFTGFTVTDGKSRRSLPKVLAEKIDRESPNVRLSETQLRQIGEQIQKLVP